jgi:transcriptional regulator with XRE-family HTH domain
MDELSLRAVIAAIQEKHGLKSQPAVARFLGVTEKTLSNWMHGRNYPDECKSCQLAELAGIDPGVLAAYCAAMRSTSPQGRETWLKVLRRLQHGANSAAPDATDSGAGAPDQCWLGAQ